MGENEKRQLSANLYPSQQSVFNNGHLDSQQIKQLNLYPTTLKVIITL